RVQVLRVRRLKLDGIGSTGAVERADWRLVTRRQLPGRPPGANVVRLGRVFGGKPSRVLLTGFVSYSRVKLQTLSERASRTLVSPFLLEAFPCAPLPTVRYGIGQTASLLVDWAFSPVADPTSPFGALPDLFMVRYLTLTDSKLAPFQLRIFQVELRGGDALLP